MRQCRLLTEEVAAAFYAVLQGNGLYRQASVLVDDLVPCRVDSMENHFKSQSLTEELECLAEKRPKGCRCIDMQRSCPPRHAESRQHTRQAETMVAVQVTDEYGNDFREVYAQTAELDLCPFSTVDHKQFLPKLYDLGGWEML